MFDAHAEILDVYRSTPATLRALVRGLPDEVIRAGAGTDQPGTTREEEWSIVEVVCHLRDAEQRVIERMRRMRDEERPLLAAYDQAQLAREANYRHQSLIRALSAFERLRREQIALLEGLDDAGWQHVGLHEEAGEITIEQLAAHTAAHDAVHLGQIARRILLPSRHGIHSVQSL